MPAIEVKPEEVVGATMRAARAPQKQEDEISLRSEEVGATWFRRQMMRTDLAVVVWAFVVVLFLSVMPKPRVDLITWGEPAESRL